jgi:hypothetical protein
MLGDGSGLDGGCNKRNRGLARALGVAGEIGRCALRNGVGGACGGDGLNTDEDRELKDVSGVTRPVFGLCRLEDDDEERLRLLFSNKRNQLENNGWIRERTL